MRTGRVSLGLVAIVGGLLAVSAFGAGGSPEKTKQVTAIHPETGELVVLTPPREGYVSAARSQDSCVAFGNDPLEPVDSFFGRQRFRGNLYLAQEDSVLLDWGMALTTAQPDSANIYFEVYRRIAGDTEYIRVGDRVVRTMTEAGCDTGFCMRGTAAGPINFEAGYEYALGVTWGQTVVTFTTQVLPIPREFGNGDGQIIGSLALPASGVPPVIEPFTPGLFTGLEYTQRLCFVPKPGACCIPPVIDGDAGSCSSMLATDCEAAGGVFQGEKSACEIGLCRFGACCSDCGECVPSMTQDGCQRTNGTWQGNRVACPADAAELCETVTGACCTNGSVGTCTDVCEEDCIAANGIYHGDGTDCGFDGHGPCFGACCWSNGCRDATQGLCNGALSGTHKGDGTRCASLSPELQCGGACCFGTTTSFDSCIPVSQLNDCSENVLIESNPSYLGDNTTCPVDCNPQGSCVGGIDHGNPCEIDAQCSGVGVCVIPSDPYGACCTSSGLCINTTQTHCADNWGDASFDLAAKCPTLFDPPRCSVGSCCLPDGSCQDITAVYCTDVLGGVYNGTATCAETTCTGPLGACCTISGCVDAVGQNSCESAGDLFLGVGSVCGAGSCPVGACCQPTGDCLDAATSTFCATIDGTYQGDATLCSSGTITCAQPGACCAETGTCLPNLLEAVCTNAAGINGTFFGEGSACGGSNICASGACCLPDETCGPRTRDACLAAGGSYQGDNTTCAAIGGDAACKIGVCCSASLGCLDPALQLACGGSGDVFDESPTASCGAFNPVCPQVGGCCTRDGGCSNMTLAACSAATGTYLGDGNFCASFADSCPVVGPCCRPDNTCEDNRFEPECSGIGDVFDLAGSCAQTNCPQAATGACCLDAQTCEQRTELDCLRITGTPDTYSGDLTSCISAQCEPSGACCQFSGVCSTGLQSSCPADLGVFHEGQTCGDLTCGACCGLDGTCTDGSLGSECTGDSVFSESRACGDANVCPTLGACCINGTCELRSRDDCISFQLGIYEGDGVSCSVTDCAEGGCCRTDGTCSAARIISQCSGDNEVFSVGDDTCGGSCVAVGACCLGASCFIGTEADCAANGGTYDGDASTCRANLCTAGGCCTPNNPVSDCSVATLQSCDADGGSYVGPNTDCSNDVCLVGSCCRGDGTCGDDVPQFACDGATDLFGAGVACGEKQCSVSGIVCTTGQDCDFLNGETCDAVVPPCIARGACCLGDETCAVMSALACTAAGGSYSGAGTDCTLDNLCVVGACCAANGACDDSSTTRFECEQFGGSYVGPGAVCEAGICTTGACCAADGTCTDDVRSPRCNDPFGEFNANMVCADVTCPLRQAAYLSSVPDSSDVGESSIRSGGTLWRTAKNVIRFTFDADVVAPLAGEIEIRELLDGGVFGADLSSSFTFTVENDGLANPRVLRIADTGSTIAHQKWYAIINTGGWTGVANFERHYASAHGDGSGDGLVQFADLAFINSQVNQPTTGDQDRHDINGDDLIQFADLAAANATINVHALPKPTGH